MTRLCAAAVSRLMADWASRVSTLLPSRPLNLATFVVKADITSLDCDAWLCPTGGVFSVTARVRATCG